MTIPCTHPLRWINCEQPGFDNYDRGPGILLPSPGLLLSSSLWVEGKCYGILPWSRCDWPWAKLRTLRSASIDLTSSSKTRRRVQPSITSHQLWKPIKSPNHRQLNKASVITIYIIKTIARQRPTSSAFQMWDMISASSICTHLLAKDTILDGKGYYSPSINRKKEILSKSQVYTKRLSLTLSPCSSITCKIEH